METERHMINNIYTIQKDKNNYRKRIIYIFFFIDSLFIFFIFIFVFRLYLIQKININLKYHINTNNNQNIQLSLSDKLKLLKIYTNNNELRYKGLENCLTNDPDSQECIYHLIVPKKVVGKNRILLGKKIEGDGTYVILDDFKDIKIAYSFGISRKIQFDKALADKGIDVFMYDHTISKLPYNNIKFHWYKIGICGKKQFINLKNLDTLIKENKHTSEKDMILKLDVEHWEWQAINDLNETILNQFKYILIEYHFNNENSQESKLYYNVIKKIAKTHQSFYVRCNGDRSNIIKFGNNRICHIMEVSYIIRENNIFTYDDTIYPIDEFEYIKQKIDGRLEMNLNILKFFDI